MQHLIKKLVLTALLAVVLPAQAAIQSWQFSGAVESGYYTGTSYQGDFSLDDAGLTASGTELLSLTSLNFSFSGTSFNLTTPALSAAKAVFEAGTFTGLEWAVDSSTPAIGFSLIAGFSNPSEAFFAYDTPLGLSGTGSLNYAVAAVPEPSQTSLMLLSLGLIGMLSLRRR